MTMTGPGGQPTTGSIDPRSAHRRVGVPARRCQLWVGHHGPRAVMLVRDAARVLRVWAGGRSSHAHDLDRDYQALPWMLGYPLPVRPGHAAPGRDPAEPTDTAPPAPGGVDHRLGGW